MTVLISKSKNLNCCWVCKCFYVVRRTWGFNQQLSRLKIAIKFSTLPSELTVCHKDGVDVTKFSNLDFGYNLFSLLLTSLFLNLLNLHFHHFYLILLTSFHWIFCFWFRRLTLTCIRLSSRSLQIFDDNSLIYSGYRLQSIQSLSKLSKIDRDYVV